MFERAVQMISTVGGGGGEGRYSGYEIARTTTGGLSVCMGWFACSTVSHTCFSGAMTVFERVRQ